MKEVKLPSGAVLKIGVVPFADARALYQSLLEEVKDLRIDSSQEVDINIVKDLVCVALSSKKIEANLEKCMARCLYKNLKIDSDTWEPVSARDDYIMACVEVTKETVAPFTKSLYAKFSPFIQGILKSPA